MAADYTLKGVTDTVVLQTNRTQRLDSFSRMYNMNVHTRGISPRFDLVI